MNEISSIAEREIPISLKHTLEEATCPDCSKCRLSNLVLVFSIAFIDNLVPVSIFQGHILSERDYMNMPSVLFSFS